MSTSKPNSVATMNEVAEAAGVSIATVSRVINGSGGVSKKLERRVRQAMDQLHYHPSSIARSFKTQETRLIGILIPLLDHPFYSRLATAIEQKLFSRDYRALICNTEEDDQREREYIEMLVRQRVDGVIINSSAKNTAYTHKLNDLRIPYILIDRNLPKVECGKVFCDNSQGGYLGMQHLLELGHRRIGIVAAPATQEPIIRRLRGVQEALTDYSLATEPDLLVTGDVQSFEMGYESARRLLAMTPRPTAIFALTDVMAIGVMHAAAEMGLSVPRDLSVVGYDDLPMASYMMPPLTTVAQPISEMGEAAVEMLFRQIDAPDAPPERSVLATRLVVRGTTANITYSD